MATARGLLLDGGTLRVPADAYDLASFRRWTRSDEFPESGRIDFVDGLIEVTMSPEDVSTHGSPKSAIHAAVFAEVRRRDLGEVWVDRTRLVHEKVGLSCEPDVLFLRWETLESGKAKLVPRTNAAEGRWIEIEGTADLVVEVVSDASVAKDTGRLRALYHAAGVREYWIADAREDSLRFSVLVWERAGYVPASQGRGGFARSRVLGRRVRLVRVPARAKLVRYTLEIVAASGVG